MESNAAWAMCRTIRVFALVGFCSLITFFGFARYSAGKDPATQPSDGSIVLGTANSRIHGFQLHIERKPRPHFVYWVDPQEYLEWPHGCVQTGKFYVELTYSCAPNTGGNYVFTAGTARISGHAEQTGGWDKWRTLRIGQVEITQEKTTAFLKADGQPQNALMDVMKLRLIPIAK